MTAEKEALVMYARMVSAQVAPDKIEALARVLTAAVVPAAQAQPGFRGALGLTDPATGKALMITLWSTPEDLVAGEASGYLGRQLATVALWLRGPTVRESFRVDIQV